MRVPPKDAVTRSAPEPVATKGDVDEHGEIVDLVDLLTLRIRSAVGDCVPGLNPAAHAALVESEVRRVRHARGLS